MPTCLLEISGEWLRCPRCGEQYLHHGGVTVFDRDEDADLTTVTTVHAGQVKSRPQFSEESANPSARRHGLAITFGCECCGGLSELTIAQHKGATIIAWRYDPADAVVEDDDAATIWNPPSLSGKKPL